MTIQLVKFCYRNILETGTVTVTTENASFPKYRLYDRNLGKLFKSTAFASPFAIVINQGAVISYEVDRLIIPAGHNLNGLACSLRYSTDNFGSDDHEAVGWTQGDALIIDKTFTAQTKQYWKLNITAPATIVEIPEIFLTKDYIFQINPILGSEEGFLDNVYSQESRSGLDYDVKFGTTRRLRTYDLIYVEETQKSDLESWKSHCEGIKPFWIYDHYGTLIYMKMLNPLKFIYLENDPSRYSCRLEFREVLGSLI